MDIVIRASVMFAILFGLLRLMGKRELGQMTPFELVMLVVVGDLIQQGITHNDFSLTGATLAIGTFAFWTVVLGWVTYLSRRAERAIEGEPLVLIRHGVLLEKSLKRDRLTRAEVESEMRLAGIARIETVAWAILEPEGRISFIKREGDDDGPPPDAPKPS
ncbi:DUF421 domain-containing protein [Sphingomonas sp. LT1P40]|uniref:DUF421 domain-containing protein n=1 Tax=Alteristakelama amylovorans TaxID=3096166 RepID=UPI002FC66776